MEVASRLPICFVANGVSAPGIPHILTILICMLLTQKHLILRIIMYIPRVCLYIEFGFNIMFLLSSRHRFHILHSPLAHISVAWYLPLSALHMMNMSHLKQLRRGWIPYSRITTVSRMCQCTMCTHSTLRLLSLPGHPPPLGK